MCCSRHATNVRGDRAHHALSFRQENRPRGNRGVDQGRIKPGPRQCHAARQDELHRTACIPQGESLQPDPSELIHKPAQARRPQRRQRRSVEAGATDLLSRECPLFHQQGPHATGGELLCGDRACQAGPDDDDVPDRGRRRTRTSWLALISSPSRSGGIAAASGGSASHPEGPPAPRVRRISPGVNAAATDTGPSTCTTREPDST